MRAFWRVFLVCLFGVLGGGVGWKEEGWRGRGDKAIQHQPLYPRLTHKYASWYVLHALNRGNNPQSALTHTSFHINNSPYTVPKCNQACHLRCCQYLKKEKIFTLAICCQACIICTRAATTEAAYPTFCIDLTDTQSLDRQDKKRISIFIGRWPTALYGILREGSSP